MGAGKPIRPRTEDVNGRTCDHRRGASGRGGLHCAWNGRTRLLEGQRPLGEKRSVAGRAGGQRWNGADGASGEHQYLGREMCLQEEEGALPALETMPQSLLLRVGSGRQSRQSYPPQLYSNPLSLVQHDLGRSLDRYGDGKGGSSNPPVTLDPLRPSAEHLVGFYMQGGGERVARADGRTVKPSSSSSSSGSGLHDVWRMAREAWNSQPCCLPSWNLPPLCP